MPSSIQRSALAAAAAFSVMLAAVADATAEDARYLDLQLRTKDATDVKSFFFGVLEFSSHADRKTVPVSSTYRSCMADGIASILPSQAKDTILRYIENRSDANLEAVSRELITIHLSLARDKSLQPISNRCDAEGLQQKYPQFADVNTREAFVERAIETGFEPGPQVSIDSLKSCAIHDMNERYAAAQLAAIDKFIQEKSLENFEDALVIDNHLGNGESMTLLGTVWRDCG